MDDQNYIKYVDNSVSPEYDARSGSGKEPDTIKVYHRYIRLGRQHSKLALRGIIWLM